MIVIAIAIAGWTTAARLVRAEFLYLREMDFVGRGQGARRRVPADHRPPHAAGRHGAARGRLLAGRRRRDHRRGRAVRPRLRDRAAARSSLGQMLQGFQEYFYRTPSASVSGITLIIVLCASFLGDGLRDALDPRQRVES